MNLPESKLTKKQTKTFTKQLPGNRRIEATVRYDDQCGNGHNSFAITGNIYENGRHTSGGCLHEDISKHFPELAPLIKWHLVSSDGPMLYIANTTYHATEHGPLDGYLYFEDKEAGISPKCMKAGKLDSLYAIAKRNPLYSVKVDEKTAKAANLEAARSCAVWPDATLEQLLDKQALKARLPALMAEFKADIESLGFTY